jgi:hypothetical protein
MSEKAVDIWLCYCIELGLKVARLEQSQCDARVGKMQFARKVVRFMYDAFELAADWFT